MCCHRVSTTGHVSTELYESRVIVYCLNTNHGDHVINVICMIVLLVAFEENNVKILNLSMGFCKND